jgi:hypothetical protein
MSVIDNFVPLEDDLGSEQPLPRPIFSLRTQQIFTQKQL